MITIKELKAMNACIEGIEWYKSNKQKTLLETLNKADNNSIIYCNWYISHKLNRMDCIRYSIYAAENVIGLFEIKNPDDNRPRKAIVAAKTYLENPTEENKNAAAYAAAYAAYAAYAVADSADSADSANAAAYAAYAAANSANAAYSAAYAAANAVDSAVYLSTLKDIVTYGIKLLELECNKSEVENDND